MDGEGQPPFDCDLVDGRALRRLDPGIGDPVGLGLRDDLGVVGVQEDPHLRLVEVLLVLDRGDLGDPIGVIEHDAVEADAPHARLGAYGRQPRLPARIAGGAFLGLAGFPVIEHLFIRATRDAHAPASALVLVHEHDAVFLALVHRARGAGRDTGRVDAVVADPRQIHLEGVLELRVHGLFHVAEVAVLGAVLELARQIILPVRAPLDLLHGAPIDQRARARGRGGLGERARLEMGVVVGEGLVVVVDLREIGVHEQVHEALDPTAGLELQLAVLDHPAAVPLALVLPVLGITDPGLGLDVVEPHVLDADAVGPDVLAGHRAGVATDALVEVHHHAEVGADFHEFNLQCLVANHDDSNRHVIPAWIAGIQSTWT